MPEYKGNTYTMDEMDLVTFSSIFNLILPPMLPITFSFKSLNIATNLQG